MNLANPGAVSTDIVRYILPDFLKPATYWLGLAWHVEDAALTQARRHAHTHARCTRGAPNSKGWLPLPACCWPPAHARVHANLTAWRTNRQTALFFIAAQCSSLRVSVPHALPLAPARKLVIPSRFHRHALRFASDRGTVGRVLHVCALPLSAQCPRQLCTATAPALVKSRTTGAYLIPLAIPQPFPEVACNETLEEQLWAFTERVIAGSASGE